MFQTEYTYKKKDGKEYKSKYPDDKDINKNIFILSGSNDLGKSTTMQIIAYGLYGLNDEEIKEEIKTKIRRLISEDTEIFQYNFKIKSLDGAIILESDNKTSTKEVRLTLNGGYINWSVFEKTFKLIFDVPEETTIKLLNSLKSIKKSLEYSIKKLENYEKFLENQREEINNSEENQKNLEKNKEELIKISEDYKNNKNELENLIPQYKYYYTMYILKKYNDLLEDIKMNQEEIDKLSKKLKKIEKNKNIPEFLKEFSLNLNSFISNRNKLLEIISQINLEPDNKKFFDDFKDKTEYFTKHNDPQDFTENMFNVINIVIKLFEESINNKKDMHTSLKEEYNFLYELNQILQKYKQINPKITVTDGKFIDQFSKEVEDRLKSITTKKDFQNLKSLEKIMDIINSMKIDIGSLQNNVKKIIKESSKDNYEDYVIQQKIDDFKHKLNLKRDELDKIKPQYLAIPEDQRNIDYSTFEESYYKILANKYNSLNDEIQNLKTRIDFIKNKIEEEKNTPTPKTNYTKDEIKSRLSIIYKLKKKLVQWKDLVDQIDLEKIPKENELDENKLKFYSVIGKYLAKVVEYIHFEDKKWELEEINLIKRSYIVKGGSTIRFVDIGTGNTSLNSLLVKIKQDYGGKKKILLLDDIGLMDNKNIERLIEEIRNQAKSGNVVLAILSIAERNKDHVEAIGIDVNGGENL